MKRLLIHPSPVPQLKLTQYEDRLFPAIRELVEQAIEQLPPEQLLQIFPAQEDLRNAVVAENTSPKGITDIQYCWLWTDTDGKTRSRRVSSSSAFNHVAEPVLQADCSLLITPQGFHNLDLLRGIVDHTCGTVGGGGGSGRRRNILPDSAFVEFSVDHLQFQD